MMNAERKAEIDQTVLSAQLGTIEAVFREYRDTLLQSAGNIDYTVKDDNSPVTELDVAIEQRICDEFARYYPGVPVFGEEINGHDANSSVFWLVDPIDGTASFVRGAPYYTNMAALIVDGAVQASVIYNPSTEKMYTAIRGEGAFVNGERLHMNTVALSKEVLVKKQFHESLVALLGDDFHFQAPPSGGGNGFTLLAEGRVGMRFQLHANGSAHDYAPGALLVVESGGVLVPIRDEVYTYESNSFVACHPSYANLLNTNIAGIRCLETETRE